MIPALAGVARADGLQEATQSEAVTAASEFTVERAYTTNALDRALALPDWINLLRGHTDVVIAREASRITLGIAAEQSAHQRLSIEDDSALRLSAEIGHEAVERLSLGGKAFLSLASEGDDIDIDDVILGIRTRTIAGGATLKAAYRLGEATSLAGELSASRSEPGPAEFEAGLLDPQQLSPRRDTIGAGLRLAHSDGDTSYASAAGAEIVQVGIAGRPPYDFRLARQFARGEAGATFGKLSLKGSAGAERLASPGIALDLVRPNVALEAAYRLASGATLRGTFNAALDLTGGDDPVGSWFRIAELEASTPLGTRLTLSAGGSRFWRENFLLGYDEDGWRAWVGTRVALTGHLSLDADFGASRRRALPDGAPIASLDASVSLVAALASPSPARK